MEIYAKAEKNFVKMTGVAPKTDDFGINVRVTRVARDGTATTSSTTDEFAERHFNCLACGYIHDAPAMRRSSGVCQKCGTLVRRAAVEMLGLDVGDVGDGIGRGRGEEEEVRVLANDLRCSA
jgi:hypothetical protein